MNEYPIVLGTFLIANGEIKSKYLNVLNISYRRENCHYGVNRNLWLGSYLLSFKPAYV